jgi:hypothetical protein
MVTVASVAVKAVPAGVGHVLTPMRSREGLLALGLLPPAILSPLLLANRQLVPMPSLPMRPAKTRQ